ncbi:large ribosomal subunit protein mL43 [Halyomorpha halys]|uniref:large ribosomal subunit protein mL43 n=1 Tax=Halyomorpha halys TaxID=286706 RepID=UPI0006D50251|nr:39S ribosomal protein L43, mitochondrial [Halyomorpha halys]
MSNSHLFMTSGFPRAPLKNGIGRYVCQLKRVTIKFCKTHGDSRGIREFLETELIDFSRNNPGVVVYVKTRRHKSPSLNAEYLNGQKEYINCHNFNKDEVNKWLHLLLSRSGKEVMRYRKMWHTETPSIQGIWTPFTFKDPKLNLASFPLNVYWGPPNPKPTATEIIMEMFRKQQLEDKETGDIETDEKYNTKSSQAQ